MHAFWSSHDTGQLPSGSHVSPASTVPLPQLGEQSLSSMALQAAGQHPSSSVQSSTTVTSHATSQVSGVPESMSEVHALLSSQTVGQLPGGSHDSPASTTPFPHAGAAVAPAPPVPRAPPAPPNPVFGMPPPVPNRRPGSAPISPPQPTSMIKLTTTRLNRRRSFTQIAYAEQRGPASRRYAGARSSRHPDTLPD